MFVCVCVCVCVCVYVWVFRVLSHATLCTYTAAGRAPLTEILEESVVSGVEEVQHIGDVK